MPWKSGCDRVETVRRWNKPRAMCATVISAINAIMPDVVICRREFNVDCNRGSDQESKSVSDVMPTCTANEARFSA